MNDLVGYLLENCCAGADCDTASGCAADTVPAQPERESA